MPSEWHRSPGQGKYARPEFERRFLVAGTVPKPTSIALIEDRYITGTQLRLRRVTASGEQIWKLTQKVRVREDDPSQVAITNFYLDGAEYEKLRELPAAEMVKTRGSHVVKQTRIAVDAFRGVLDGLCLAEVEVDRLDDDIPKISWLGKEVTHDDRYTGGRLASLTAEAARTLLGGEAGHPAVRDQPHR